MFQYSKKYFSSINNKTTKLGWIGTGVMGQYMCEHLIKSGYQVNVYNRSLHKCQNLANMGANIVSSPMEVGINSDIIFSIVGYPSDVRDIILNDNNGLLNGCKNGNIIVDMTTSEPSLAIEIENKALLKGVYSLDAPVSGGDIGAKNGTLSIMVGGNKIIYDKITTLLNIIGNNVQYMGNAGLGQHTKMVNQILISTTMIGVCEGLIYGYKSGLQLNDLINIISKGAASSFSLNVLGNRIINGNYNPGFYVEHFIKDMEIALNESKKMNLCLPGLALAQQLYMALKAQNHSKKGTQALILALEQLSGIEYFKNLEQKTQEN
mmetsp:Transcript_76704/g.94161  ORF Transcript_76704/g.94161 Transcript_76704/m.94161 type:complete len:321 (+) Transcript_76704:553-1515(+)